LDKWDRPYQVVVGYGITKIFVGTTRFQQTIRVLVPNPQRQYRNAEQAFNKSVIVPWVFMLLVLDSNMFFLGYIEVHGINQVSGIEIKRKKKWS
jgi:hypothetical protein